MRDNYGDYIYKNNNKKSKENLSEDFISNQRDGNGNLIKERKCENCGEFVSTNCYNIHYEQCLNNLGNSDSDEFDSCYDINSQLRSSVDVRGI